MGPIQGRNTAASLYQGSRPSLADYALLGLSRSLLWGSSLRHRSVLDWQSMGPIQGRNTAASAVPGLTPFAGRLRPVGAVEVAVVGIFTTSSIRSRLAIDGSHSGPKYGCIGCTRAHALRWQITPRWGCRDRCCGDFHYGIDPFSIGSRCVPFRAGQFSLRPTRAHA